MCRSCLATAAAVRDTAGSSWRNALWPLLAVTGWLLAWILFYYLGHLLARIPHTVHGAGAG